MTSRSDPVVAWLLGGDPSIRWQTLQDLVGAAPRTVERERRRFAHEAWGSRLSFPPRWHYDILRGLDHFRAVGSDRDERLSDAIGLLGQKRRPDGRWRLESRYRGKTYFKLERINASSRWNTLRALRVLRWWDGADGTGGSTCS